MALLKTMLSSTTYDIMSLYDTDLCRNIMFLSASIYQPHYRVHMNTLAAKELDLSSLVK